MCVGVQYSQMLAVPLGMGRYDPGLQAFPWYCFLQREQSGPVVLCSHSQLSFPLSNIHELAWRLHLHLTGEHTHTHMI